MLEEVVEERRGAQMSSDDRDGIAGPQAWHPQMTQLSLWLQVAGHPAPAEKASVPVLGPLSLSQGWKRSRALPSR